MPVVFTPYLDQARERLPSGVVTPSADEASDPDADPARRPVRLVVGAAVAGVVAAVIAWRLRRANR